MAAKHLKSIFMMFFIMTGIGFGQINKVIYTESQDIIANPERGFFRYSETDSKYYTKTNYSNIEVNQLNNWRNGVDKVTLMYRQFQLNQYKNSDIPQNYLDNIQIDFDRIRAAGYKIMVRFAYSITEGSSAQQANKAQMLQHISQLAPILNNNKDVIFSVQLGFIGTWGEWYYTNSTEFGDEDSINETQWNNRKDIVDALLSALSDDIFVQLRYVYSKQQMYGSTPLDATTAFTNTPSARIGFYNDAFLNNWGDMATYTVNSKFENPIGTPDYVFLTNETKYTPMTGEMNGKNPPRTDCANAKNEMNLTNFISLNREYYKPNIDKWITNGCFNDIIKKMGYRFVLKNSTFNYNESKNRLTVTINIQNKGYATSFKNKTVQLVAENTSTHQKFSFPLNTDVRLWEKAVKIRQVLDVSALASGEYTFYLSVTDDAISDRPEYALQFANQGLWVASFGLNYLNQTIIKGAGSKNRPAEEDLLSIAPNPARNIIKITIPEDKTIKEVFIFSSSNQKSETVSFEKSTNTVDLSRFASGIYFIKVSFTNGTTATKKLILNK